MTLTEKVGKKVVWYFAPNTEVIDLRTVINKVLSKWNISVDCRRYLCADGSERLMYKTVTYRLSMKLYKCLKKDLSTVQIFRAPKGGEPMLYTPKKKVQKPALIHANKPYKKVVTPKIRPKK